MTEYNNYIAKLIGKYLEDSLSAEEHIELTEWINASDNNRHLFTEMTDKQQLTTHLQRIYAYDSDRIAQKISAKIPAFGDPKIVELQPVSFLKKWGWAAAVAVLVLGGTYYYRVHTKEQPTNLATNQSPIMPGQQGAILTLADGRQVVLDTLSGGLIASQNGASIVLADGKLVYDPTSAGNAEVQYNIMTTPKGRQFELTLPDGTKVWLNAASTIRYPTAFTGKERKVTVSGEVYFEVIRDADKPFFVSIDNKAAIEVLGTSFNVNAYENEHSIQTTLVNGSVRVGVPIANQSKILNPGQQATIVNKQITVAEIKDLDKILAWKYGLFNFDGANLEEVMRQLERWYNIEVVYENGIPNTRFIGEMSRQIPLTDLLDILKKTEVDFRVEGRKLIVLNK
ncbi:FecR family protein [Chitinophaga silvatica]|uniref:FecR family protein n=1 Tax=Chitinophaga silvatica TaxID=2282649 RepID=A0A3E1Y8P1_9BACT|nr:FecR family protein [Chitinophaga silvatica]RFS21777.1 FecR family protein [Chitinophaga silvatica]